MRAWTLAAGVTLMAATAGFSGGVGSAGTVVTVSPELKRIVPEGARIEKLAGGFKFTEGPLWMPGGFLIFSDIPNDALVKWDPKTRQVSDYRKPSGNTNGTALDARGRLICCEHSGRRVSRKEGDRYVTIADRYEGKRFNSPNDVVVKSDGSIYFTDPPYGLPQRWEDPRRELDFCGVYRLDPSGELRLLHADLTRPNGLAFSPDERLLYVANSDPDHAVWKRFVVQEDGSLDEGVVFVDVTDLVGAVPGLPDGLKVDRSGNLFATAPGGVHVYDPEGNRLGRIDTGIATANCAWGDDGSTLYLCSDMYLCRIRTRTRGAGW